MKKNDLAANTVKVLAMSMGEPTGISPDIILSLYSRKHKVGKLDELPPFLVVGDKQALIDRAILLKPLIGEISIKETAPEQASETFAHSIPIFDIGSGGKVEPGKLDIKHAPTVIKSIEKAVGFVAEGECKGLVTAPIQKSVLVQTGFKYMGHTDFLQALARQYGHNSTSIMMLASEELRVVPLTIHQSLASVPSDITPELIIKTAHIVHQSLQQNFAISTPHIAISALNPHAGENGAMGTEDDDIIVPAIKNLTEEGINVSGPHPADTLFHEAARKNYDAVICMYHDQALIPIKTLSFDTAVNVTLGLPFVRTSPDHGTALDIAGSGQARDTSLHQALLLADRMSNKLQSQGITQ